MPSKVEQMRDTLLQAIEAVKDGSMSPEKAKAIASLAHQVNHSLDVELRVLLAAKQSGVGAALVAPATVIAIAPPMVETDLNKRVIPSGVVERNGASLRHTMT